MDKLIKGYSVNVDIGVWGLGFGVWGFKKTNKFN